MDVADGMVDGEVRRERRTPFPLFSKLLLLSSSELLLLYWSSSYFNTRTTLAFDRNDSCHLSMSFLACH